MPHIHYSNVLLWARFDVEHLNPFIQLWELRMFWLPVQAGAPVQVCTAYVCLVELILSSSFFSQAGRANDRKVIICIITSASAAGSVLM